MPVDPSLAALDEIEVPEQDTPESPVETEAPVEDTPESPEQLVDWEDRYNNLRSFADRRANEYQQELEEARQRLAAIEAQQSQHSDVEYDEDDDDPLVRHIQQMEARQAALEQQLAAQREADTLAEQQEQEYTYIDAEIGAIEKKLGTKLSDTLANRLGRDAQAMRDEHGRPDVQRAFSEWRRDLEAEKKAWVESKPQSARPATGPGAVEVPDLDDPEQLEEYLDRAFDPS